MDYANGKIYRIICEETGRQYIGSTCSTLVKRLSGHKRSKRCACKDFINPKIILIEDYPCERKEQLLMRERYHMENMDCINIRRSIISKEERKINDQNKYIRRKEFLMEKVNCKCGLTYTRQHKHRHERTASHKKLLGSVEL